MLLIIIIIGGGKEHVFGEKFCKGGEGFAKSEILSEKKSFLEKFQKMGVTGEWGGSDIIHIFVDLENNTFSEKLPFKQFFTCFIFHAYFIHNGANSKIT